MTYKPVPSEERCQGRVSDQYTDWQCHHRGTVVELTGGKFCRQHSPSVEAKRRAERQAVWDAKWIAKRQAEKEAAAHRAELERWAALYPELLAVCLALRHAYQVRTIVDTSTSLGALMPQVNAVIAKAQREEKP